MVVLEHSAKPAVPSAVRDRWRELCLRQETILIGVYVLMVLAFTLLNHRYFSTAAFANILQDFGPVMLMAIGETFVIITGGIDLSVGALLGLAGVGAALAIRSSTRAGMHPSLSILLGILTAVAIGALVGVVNGLMVTRVKLAPFIATLATMGACTGTTLLITGGVQIAGAPRQVIAIGNARVAGMVTAPLMMVFVALIVSWLILSRTRFGRHTYGIGSNVFAARVSGINVNRHLMKVYVGAGVLSAMAGLFVYFRLGSGSPSSGRGGELQAIAAAVIGGVSLMGGVGRLGGVALGSLITMSVLSGLILVGVEPNAQQIVVGVIIAAAVAVQGVGRRPTSPEV
jgi:ribose transport system permease protein